MMEKDYGDLTKGQQHGVFLRMSDDEVLEHLLALEREHGKVDDVVIDFAIDYPMVKTEGG
jgi:hypothetical protein